MSIYKNMKLWIFGLFFFSSAIFADHCEFWGFGGMCFFTTFDHDENAEVNFYCDTPNAVMVTMVNHNVLIGGFTTDRGIGAGKYSNIGIDTMGVLNQHYFSVRNDPGHYGVKHVLVLALGTIDCKIGKGNRTVRFPGMYGHES